MQQLVIDYKITFNSEHGKRVLDDLDLFSGYRKSSFNKDPYLMAFLEGQRNVALRIHRILEETNYEKDVK